MNINIPLILSSDSYKFSHFQQYPEGTTRNYNYIESRGISNDSMLTQDAEAVFFGLQAFKKEYLTRQITRDDVDYAEKIATAHGVPFNREGWDIIVNEYDGRLPISIEALPEGTPIRPGVPMVQVHNTDNRLPWLTSYVETAILRAVWYPTTVATLSREVKKIILKNLRETSDSPDEQIPFKLHDFGARGVSSQESAVLGGMAHLVNFMGTDTVESLVGVMEYYGADGPVGFSIPASEHSTITSWGRDKEFEAFENMVDKFGKPGAIFACVSDSYNIFKAVDEYWPRLKQKIIDSGSTLVVRPDSGDPVEVMQYVVKSLEESFGYETNSKGYKVLNNVRVIQGDGVNPESIKEMLDMMKQYGFSGDNIAFGMGGALLQKVDRDTLKFAMKTCAVAINNEIHDVYKDPITQSGKKSKKGIQAVVMEKGVLTAVRMDDLRGRKNYLQLVYYNGKLMNDVNFDEVRQNAKVV